MANLSDFIDSFTQNLAPMKAYNQSIGWDPNKNALDQNYNSPLKAQYENFVNTQLKPDWQMNTYAPAANSYGINNAANGGWMLGNNSDSWNSLNSGLQRDLSSKTESAFNTYNNLANQNYQNGLQSYYLNPTSFTKSDPNATTSSAPATPQTPAVNTQPAATGGFNNYKVKSGDSLYGIWNNQYKNKMGWTDFKNATMKNNGLSNPNLIYSGSTLKLPGL